MEWIGKWTNPSPTAESSRLNGGNALVISLDNPDPTPLPPPPPPSPFTLFLSGCPPLSPASPPPSSYSPRLLLRFFRWMAASMSRAGEREREGEKDMDSGEGWEWACGEIEGWNRLALTFGEWPTSEDKRGRCKRDVWPGPIEPDSRLPKFNGDAFATSSTMVIFPRLREREGEGVEKKSNAFAEEEEEEALLLDRTGGVFPLGVPCCCCCFCCCCCCCCC